MLGQPGLLSGVYMPAGWGEPGPVRQLGGKVSYDFDRMIKEARERGDLYLALDAAEMLKERAEMAEAELAQLKARIEALATAWRDRSNRKHRCPDYESCIDCPVNDCYSDRVDDLMAAMKGGEHA